MITAELLHRAVNARAVADSQCALAGLLLAAGFATDQTIEGVLAVALDYLTAEDEAFGEMVASGEITEIAR